MERPAPPVEQLVLPTEEMGPKKPSLDIYLNKSMIDGLRVETSRVEELIALVESLISFFKENKDDNEFSDLESYLIKIKNLQETLEDITTDISKKFLDLTTEERRDFYKPHSRKLNLARNALRDLKSKIEGYIAKQEQAKKAGQPSPWLYRVGHPNFQSFVRATDHQTEHNVDQSAP